MLKSELEPIPPGTPSGTRNISITHARPARPRPLSLGSENKSCDTFPGAGLGAALPRRQGIQAACGGIGGSGHKAARRCARVSPLRPALGPPGAGFRASRALARGSGNPAVMTTSPRNPTHPTLSDVAQTRVSALSAFSPFYPLLQFLLPLRQLCPLALPSSPPAGTSERSPTSPVAVAGCVFQSQALGAVYPSNSGGGEGSSP